MPSPIRADIEIAIDTTGSMGGAISQAKAQAIDMVNKVQAQIPTNRFAVVDFKDSFDTPEYLLRQPMTTSAAAVHGAINAMSAGGGGDTPEAHNLVFRNSYAPASGGPIGWATNSTKVVVVISDAEPHGAATAGMSGCADTSADPHGYNTATELAGMKANGRILFMVRAAATASTTLPCYQSIAAKAAAGSQGVDLGANLGDQMVALLNGTTTTIGSLTLSAVSASPAPATTGWVTSYTPASYTAFQAPATKSFNINVKVPLTAPGGSYTFTFKAYADGADVGTHVLTVVVRPGTRLTLEPAVLSATTAPSVTPYVLTANATLRQSPSGLPVPNQRVDFYANALVLGTTYLCSGYTDANGRVTCSVPLTGEVAVALATGYDGYFNGSTYYLPSSDHGPLVDVNGTPIP